MIRARLLVPLAVVPATLALTLTGTASAAPSAQFAVSTDVVAAAKPLTSITGKPVHFAPAALKAKRSGTSGSTCTAAKIAFRIANTTAKPQPLTSNGTVVFTIPAKKTVGICYYSPKPTKAQLALKSNPKAKLTVTFS